MAGADSTGGVRVWLLMMLAGLALASGCARKAAGKPPSGAFSDPGPLPAPLSAEAAKPKLIVTPEEALIGSVAKVNSNGRYVILNFRIGHLPAMEQRLNVYHLGLKVGEVRVTGPQLDDNVVADLVSGDALAGDEVRDR